jgi:hypothetical protein
LPGTEVTECLTPEYVLNQLLRVLNPSGADGHKLLRDRPGIVVRHAPKWLDLYVVAGSNELSLWETDSMALYDLLGQGLRRRLLGWGICEGELRSLVMGKRCLLAGCRPY